MSAYQTLVVGTDGSDTSLRAVDHAAAFAADNNAKLTPMSSPRTSHSPVCNPARTWMPSACTASRIAMAQRMAR
jgi:nucleotide-binding universal stress UspA family protein